MKATTLLCTRKPHKHRMSFGNTVMGGQRDRWGDKETMTMIQGHLLQMDLWALALKSLSVWFQIPQNKEDKYNNEEPWDIRKNINCLLVLLARGVPSFHISSAHIRIYPHFWSAPTSRYPALCCCVMWSWGCKTERELQSPSLSGCSENVTTTVGGWNQQGGCAVISSKGPQPVTSESRITGKCTSKWNVEPLIFTKRFCSFFITQNVLTFFQCVWLQEGKKNALKWRKAKGCFNYKQEVPPSVFFLKNCFTHWNDLTVAILGFVYVGVEPIINNFKNPK